MAWHLTRLLPTQLFRRLPVAWTLWLGLLLFVPLHGHAADCRPVAAADDARDAGSRATPGAAARKPGADKRQDFSRGLLWRIETPGIAPSHLFGTYHTNDPRITTLPCPVKDVFDRASSYTMEVITNGAGIVSMAEAMFFNDGKTLKDVLGERMTSDLVRVRRGKDTAEIGELQAVVRRLGGAMVQPIR